MEIVFEGIVYRVNAIDISVLDYLVLQGYFYFDFPNIYTLREAGEEKKSESPLTHPSALTATLSNAALRLSACGLRPCCNAALMHKINCSIKSQFKKEKYNVAVAERKQLGPSGYERISMRPKGVSTTEGSSLKERSDSPKDKDRMISPIKMLVKEKKINEIDSDNYKNLSTVRSFCGSVNKKLHSSENDIQKNTRKLRFSENDLVISKAWEGHAKDISPGIKYNIKNQADAIRRIREKLKFTDEQFFELLEFVRNDEFWRDKSMSPNGLLKRSSSNGLMKIENILTSMHNNKTCKTQRAAIAVAKKLGQTDSEINEMINDPWKGLI